MQVYNVAAIAHVFAVVAGIIFALVVLWRIRDIERSVKQIADNGNATWVRLVGVNQRLRNIDGRFVSVSRYLDAIREFLLTDAKRVDVGHVFWAQGDGDGFVGAACYCDGKDIRFVGVHRDRALSPQEIEFVNANDQRIWNVLKWKLATRETSVVCFDELMAAVEGSDDASEGEETEEEDGSKQPAVQRC
ncbi:hypothetical protein [Paludisphaera rhizosphaerae]|uniref:hypothetical protein n=1 Tax=Paludisphaera rhizosphaerae TaxID=2711216 RepID=UPI0013ED2C83|nr:hypothetical protein [Paludisphaera rhizosphaerae]